MDNFVLPKTLRDKLSCTTPEARAIFKVIGEAIMNSFPEGVDNNAVDAAANLLIEFNKEAVKSRGN